MWGTLLTWIAFLLAWDCYWIQSDCIHHRDRMHGFDQRGFHDVLLGRHLEKSYRCSATSRDVALWVERWLVFSLSFRFGAWQRRSQGL